MILYLSESSVSDDKNRKKISSKVYSSIKSFLRTYYFKHHSDKEYTSKKAMDSFDTMIIPHMASNKKFINGQTNELVYVINSKFGSATGILEFIKAGITHKRPNLFRNKHNKEVMREHIKDGTIEEYVSIRVGYDCKIKVLPNGISVTVKI